MRAKPSGTFWGALGMEAVIPPRANRTEAMAYDKEKDKLREPVERVFNKLKQIPPHGRAG